MHSRLKTSRMVKTVLLDFSWADYEANERESKPWRCKPTITTRVKEILKQ